MKELIDKAAVFAEIEKLKAYLQIPNAQLEAIQVCDNVISVINTLETKEVNLEKEFDKYCENLYVIDIQEAPFTEMYDCAKYFFELGLKAKGE